MVGIDVSEAELEKKIGTLQSFNNILDIFGIEKLLDFFFFQRAI